MVADFRHAFVKISRPRERPAVHAEFKSVPKLQRARKPRRRVSPRIKEGTPPGLTSLELALFAALRASSDKNHNKGNQGLLLGFPLLTSCVPWGVRAARKPGQIPRKPAPRQWR